MRLWLKVLAKAAAWYLGVCGAIFLLSYCAARLPTDTLAIIAMAIVALAGFAGIAAIIYVQEKEEASAQKGGDRSSDTGK